MGLGGGGPGGRRVGRILRFAEADKDFGVRIRSDFGSVPSTRLSPTRGWPYSSATRIPPGQDQN